MDPLAEKYPSLNPYNYVANNPLKYFDPDGKVIKNSFKMVLSNKKLISSTKKFDAAVAKYSGKKSSQFTFEITGGDRYKKGDMVYSKTNNSLIDKSSKISRHLQERGAVAVDLSNPYNISNDIIEKAAKEAGFTEIKTDYKDGHFHIALDPTGEDKDSNKNYIPTNSDFQNSNDSYKNLSTGTLKSLLNFFATSLLILLLKFSISDICCLV